MLWRWSNSASPLEFAVTKNASASPLECALKKLLDLKPPEIISYKNMPGVPLRSRLYLSETRMRTPNPNRPQCH